MQQAVFGHSQQGASTSLSIWVRESVSSIKSVKQFGDFMLLRLTEHLIKRPPHHKNNPAAFFSETAGGLEMEDPRY